uniref:Uncharacterized protein n=1 Tax=Arundo donax TaxID=35708 RepID=A0A0A9E949_ARUDO
MNSTTIRLAMLYGAECWPTKRRHIQQLSVVEMRMLRWICDHTRRDRVQNDEMVLPQLDHVWWCIVVD